jgi:putative hydrolase of the HAD superfamily
MATISPSPPKPNGIRGIVLDAVGTLIHPSPSVATAYTEAARRQGTELDPVEVKARFTRHFAADEAHELRGPLGTDEPTERRRWRRIVVDSLPEVADIDRAFDELWDHFARPEHWRPFPDAPEAIDRLRRAGFRLVIGSNFDARLRPVIAGLSELSWLSNDLVISSEVGYRKPHPGFYRSACDRLGLPISKVMAVGDDPTNDLEGPRRAGLSSILIDRDGRADDEGATASRLPDLAALADLLCDDRDEVASHSTRNLGPSGKVGKLKGPGR